MRILSFILIVFLFACSTPRIAGHYAMGMDNVLFNNENMQFSFVERSEQNFYKYADGSYSQNKRFIYVNSNRFDSCIRYSIRPIQGKSTVLINCINPDKRFIPIYIINGKRYVGSFDTLFSFRVEEHEQANIIIKVPFPNNTFSDCYKKYDTLSRKILLSPESFSNQAISISYYVNYNYYNWNLLVDTFKVVGRNKVKSAKKVYPYRKIDSNIKDSVNYFNGCLIQ